MQASCKAQMEELKEKMSTEQEMMAWKQEDVKCEAT